MTNKLLNPWLNYNENGLFYDAFQSQEAAENGALKNQILAYAEPFEPIKLTKEQAEAINHACDTYPDNLGNWWQNLKLHDEDIAFLFIHRDNWRDFVEIEPEKKYYLISRDLEAIGNKNKFFNQSETDDSNFWFDTTQEIVNEVKTQFTQKEIDKLGDKASRLRKEEVA